MNFFKKAARKIGKEIGIIPNNNTEEIMDERAKLKSRISDNLRKINFTDEEINDVLSILKKCEEDVQEQKDLLVGTNINNDHVTETMKIIFDEIRRLELKAADDMRAKIAEITQKKKSN